MRHLLTDEKLTYLARWIVVLCPLFLILGVIGNEIPASLVAALFLLRSTITRDWGWTRQNWVRIALLLWGYMLIRSIGAEDPKAALALAGPWIRFPLFGAACAYWLLPDIATQKRLSWAILGCSGFLIFDALFQYSFGHDLFGHVPFTNARLTGPFTKPRVGVISSWFLLPAIAVIRLYAPQRKFISIVLAGLFATVGVVTVYLTGERMAFLLSVMACGILCLFDRRFWFVAPVLALLAALTIHQVNQQDSNIAARQDSAHQQITSYLDTPYGRLMLSALEIAKAHPLFGAGPGHFRIVCERPEYGSMDPEILHYRCANHTHNLYTEWLAENGAIGLGLFIAMVLQWVALAWKARRAIFTNTLTAALLCVMLMRLFPAAASASQFVSWMAMPFWLLAGLLIARLTNYMNQVKHDSTL